MKPIAVPLIGGMVTSTVHVLLVTPIIFFIVKRHELKRGRLKLSGLRATEELQESEEETSAPTDALVVENVREEEEPLSEVEGHEPGQRSKRRVAAIALIAATLAVAFAAAMLMRDRSPGDRRPLDSETVSGITVSVAEDGASAFALTFEDTTSRQPVAVTNVTAEALMPAMGSMPQMTVPLAIEPGGAPGRYRVRGKLMKGTWQVRVRFSGPAGPAQAVLEVNV